MSVAMDTFMDSLNRVVLDDLEMFESAGPYCRVCEGPTDYALSRCTWCGAEDPCELMRG